MKSIKILIIFLLGVILLSSCKKDVGSNTPVNPDVELEEDEYIEKTLYASLNENYANTTIVNEYFLELTNKGNFYFTEDESESIKDEVVTTNKVYYKGTYLETETKLLLEYEEYNILDIDEFTKKDGLYIVENKGIAFSTRMSDLSETSYIGLYYSIIDEKIYSIELMTNNEAVVRIDDEIYYCTYNANVSNIYIRELNMNLIINGTTLIYGDNIFERNSSSKVEVIGFITNLEESIMMEESLNLLGKYVDVCYSDFKRVRYYITKDMFNEYKLKSGYNVLEINLDDIVYEYELYVINYIELLDNLEYQAEGYSYFKVTYSSDLVIKYDSVYNIKATLLDSNFNVMDEANEKMGCFIPSSNVGDVIYLKLEATTIDVNLELIKSSQTAPSGEYEYSNDKEGLYLKLDSTNNTYRICYISVDHTNDFDYSGGYTFSNGYLSFDESDIVIRGNKDYIAYENFLLEKKTSDVIFAYVLNEQSSINTSIEDLKKIYLTSNGIVEESLLESEILGYRRDYYGNYNIVALIKGIYAYTTVNVNTILEYKNNSYISNINSNILYKATLNGNYVFRFSGADEYLIEIYDSNYNLLDTINDLSEISLSGSYYFRVYCDSKNETMLTIDPVVQTKLNGMYRNGESYLNFDNNLYDGNTFIYDDKYITVLGEEKPYKVYGNIVLIDGIPYKNINNEDGIIEGIYQLESNNEVMIVEIKGQELTYLYTTIESDAVTDYDTNIKIDNYKIESKVGTFYHYKEGSNRGLLIKGEEDYINLVRKDLEKEIVDAKVSFNKTTFFMGDALTGEDIDITVLYSNGSISEYVFDSSNVKYFTTQAIGDMKYSLIIGDKTFDCNYTVVSKTKIYLNRKIEDLRVSNKVYEFKPSTDGDYLISIVTDEYKTYSASIYNDYNLKSLVTTFTSNSFYASELINCSKDTSYYIYVNLPVKSNLSINISLDDSIVGTYVYNESRLIFNSNKSFEYNDYVNSVRYIGLYEANRKNNYDLHVTKQYQIEGSTYKEVEITTFLIEIECYGDIVILEGNYYVNSLNEINYVGTYYCISNNDVKKIELSSEQSIGGGILKYSASTLNETQSSSSSKYVVEGSILKASSSGFLYIENEYTLLMYEGNVYIKLDNVSKINSTSITVNVLTYTVGDVINIDGYITILYNDSKIEHVDILNSMVENIDDITKNEGEYVATIQYKNIAFNVTFIVEGKQ